MVENYTNVQFGQALVTLLPAPCKRWAFKQGACMHGRPELFGGEHIFWFKDSLWISPRRNFPSTRILHTHQAVYCLLIKWSSTYNILYEGLSQLCYEKFDEDGERYCFVPFRFKAEGWRHASLSASSDNQKWADFEEKSFVLQRA